ncbi:MAG TPA: lysozyme, partial [Devosia sp.]|nr:lysozyme [Devosia sp.]
MAGLGDNYLDAIRGFEGFNPKPYWDYRQWTSGYGTRASGPGDTVDRAEADRRLNTELGNAASRVDSLGVPMSPGQRAALSSLTFNAGPSWMNSGLGAAVRSGDWDTARQRFLQYVNAGGQPLEGLRNRRMAEAQWFDEQPQQPQPAAQPAPPAQTEQPGGQRMAGLLDWLIPQAEAGTPGSFAPANRREQFGPPRWLYSPPMESIAPPSVNPRTGAPIPSMLPPGRSRALGGGGAAPAAAAAAPLGVPGPMMPGGGIGSDFAASPPQPPQVPPFDEGTTSLDPETIMRLAQAEHGRQNPQAPAPRRPGFGEAMESWMSSPLFQAAVALATQRDPAAAMASAGTARRQQSEYERQQSQRTTMDRIWGEAFPNGQPNMQHPLLAGQQPNVATMIAGLGPEQAIPLLARSAMERRQLEFKTAGDQAFIFDPRTGQSMPVPGSNPKPPEAIRTTALKVNASYNSLTTALDDYQRLVQREGITALPGQARDAVTQARTNIQLQLKELYNLGVLNGPDLSLMEQLLTDTSPSPGNILSNPSGRVGSSIQRLKAMLKTLRDNAVAAAGGQAPAAAEQSSPNRLRYDP